MNAPQRKRTNQRRPARPKEHKPVNIWRAVPALPEPAPIVAADEPAALVRSLGDPPMSAKSVVSGHYVAAVIERAAALATALATSADLLQQPNPD